MVMRFKDLEPGKQFAFKKSIDVIKIDNYLPIFQKIIINVNHESKFGIFNPDRGVANIATEHDNEQEVFVVS